jgi:glutathione synthase/RimK-type ligase-like ATP-grasp enzyme
MKKRVAVGILYSGRKGKDEEIFLKLAKKNNIKLCLINISAEIGEEKIRKFANECDIIYNSTAEDFSIEVVKTIEGLKRKIIETSEEFYNVEDKWIFYMKCKDHGVPVPETILLSGNINIAKKELLKFDKWPVVLKRVDGTMGQFVEKAESISQAEKVIEKMWSETSERFPIIAQEMVLSPCYRVTIIDGKIAQTALKENHGWKATGVYSKKDSKKFPVDKSLEKIIKDLSKFVKIKVCGVDLLKKGEEWVVLEVNSEPAFDFIETEREKLIGTVLEFLKKEAVKN